MIKELALALAVGSGFLANVQAQSGLGASYLHPEGPSNHILAESYD